MNTTFTPHRPAEVGLTAMTRYKCNTCMDIGQITSGTVDPERNTVHFTWILCPEKDCTAVPSNSEAPWKGAEIPWRRFDHDGNMSPQAAQEASCQKCKGTGHERSWENGKFKTKTCGSCGGNGTRYPEKR